MNFPSDFDYVNYQVTVSGIQKEINDYINQINESNGDIQEISSGSVSVSKLGDRFHITVYPGCWILKGGE